MSKFPSEHDDRSFRWIHSFWKRIQRTASIRVQRRFIETLAGFFHGVTQECRDRKSGSLPDLESYILLRRDTSGCKPSFVLIEYANNLDIPDDVLEDPILSDIIDAANDFISWANVRSMNISEDQWLILQ